MLCKVYSDKQVATKVLELYLKRVSLHLKTIINAQKYMYIHVYKRFVPII